MSYLTSLLMSTHGDVEKIPWFHFKYGTIFLIQFGTRTQKPTTNTLHYDNHTRFTHETSSCVHMCSLSVFQERATTRHTHFIVFIRLCGCNGSRALESSRRRFFCAYFILFYFYFLFSLFIFMVSSTMLFIV